jgi:YD repeat-containing protein
MLTKKSILFLLFTGTFGCLKAQSNLSPTVIPPSPDAAALGKYGNQPVGLHTGIPDISIPLYTIKSPRLEVPISISYHASGIKVNEIASWVGLGWVLNAGGEVSRSVVGRCDEGQFWVGSPPRRTANQITDTDYDYMSGMIWTMDPESDLYFYNFNGHSGKFFYKQNIATPMLIPEAPLVITYNQGFIITDETGTIYKFGSGEQTSVASGYGTGFIIPPYFSSYHLTEIISADGTDHIYFNYVAGGSYTEFDPVYIETVGEICIGNDPTVHNNNDTPINYTTTRGINPIRLSEIKFSNGRVEFISAGRSDESNTRLSEIRVFGKKPDGSDTLHKKFTFGEGYLDNRLKLTGLAEQDGSGITVKNHLFSYNEAVHLPQRTSKAQDWWGFYNGHDENTTLIQSETVSYQGITYHVGGAVRDPDGIKMQAGVLNKIVYPTGGSTEFDYEPHRYGGGFVTVVKSAASGAMGDSTSLLQQTVTFTPQNEGFATVHVNCSDVTDNTPTWSRVTLGQQGSTQYLVYHSYEPYVFHPYPSQLAKDYYVYLYKNVVYELKVRSKGHSTSTQMNHGAFAQATVTYRETNPGATSIAGGLRVKEIRDYETIGGTPIRKIYKYGLDTAGIGILLIPAYGMSNSKQPTITESYNRPPPPTGGCLWTCTAHSLVISARPPLDLTTLNGAPVVYPQVTVYENNLSAPNGKEVHYFDVVADLITGVDPAYNNGEYQSNDSWKGGEENYSGIYKGSTNALVKETFRNNPVLTSLSSIGTKLGWKVNLAGDCEPLNDMSTRLSHFFYWFDYTVLSGVKKTTLVKETLHSSSDPQIILESEIDYAYDNLSHQHQQITRKITMDSEGNQVENQYWYAADYGSIENIPSLIQKNIIAIPIKEEVHKNGNILSGKVSRPDLNGKPFEIHQYESATLQAQPVHSPSVLIPAGYVKRADIAYSASTQNITSVNHTNDVTTSYLWGYNNALPIAEVKNADLTPTGFNTSNVVSATVATTAYDVALSQSFEIFTNQSTTPSITVTMIGTNGPATPLLNVYLKRSDGITAYSQNCTWGANTVGSIALSPGVYQWFYTSTVTTGSGFNGDNLSITTNYVGQSLKAFHTSFEENGITSADSKTGTKAWSGTYVLNLPAANGSYKLSYWQKTGSVWTLNEQTVTVAAGTVQPMTIGATGSMIDEVRLYPVGAAMTTYTYDPINGITSVTDASLRTTRYEYDKFGRLAVVKDDAGNLVKAFTYNYKQ